MIRNFGVEIECFATTRGVTRRVVAQAIADMGFPADVASYTGRGYDEWQIKTDASIRSDHGEGMEVVSRILNRGEASMNELRTVAAYLGQNCGVNSSTGLHVHVDVSDLPPAARLAVAVRWSMLQSEIALMLPPSRRRNTYAPVMPVSTQDELIRNILRGNFIHRTGHFAAVNTDHLETRKTLEFRQHSGTVNAEKICNWVRFLNDFIDDTKRIHAEYASPVVPQTPSQAAATIVPNPSSRFRVDSFRANSRSAVLFEHFMRNSHVQLSTLPPHEGRAWTPKMLADAIYPLRQAGMHIARHGNGDRLVYMYQPQASSANVAPTTAATPPASRDFAAMLRQPMRLSENVKAWVEMRKAVMREDLH